ncbi:MAG: DUF3021 family protein, partial [Lachnospiraceae bacterium]|nr:DUF3021 family protein [Lachnospiraceae bacterium]
AFLTGVIRGEAVTLQWPWYIPLSIVFTGFACALPTLLLISGDDTGAGGSLVRVPLHFVCIWLLVTGCGYVFGWYAGWREYVPIAVMYVLIYGFVWFSTAWLAKSDENKINRALTEVRDEE